MTTRMELFALARLVVRLVFMNGKGSAQWHSTRGANKAAGVIIVAECHKTWFAHLHRRPARDTSDSCPLALGVVSAAVVESDKWPLHGRLATAAYKAARVEFRALHGKTRLADQNGRPARVARSSGARALTLIVKHSAIFERHK